MKSSPRSSRGSATILLLEIGTSARLRLLTTLSLLLPALGALTFAVLHSPTTAAVLAMVTALAAAGFVYHRVHESWGRGVYSRAATLDGWCWETIRRDNGAPEQWVLTDWYRTSWLVVLYLRQADSRKRGILVLPRDAVPGKVHRRLRAMLWRMRAPESDADSPVSPGG